MLEQLSCGVASTDLLPKAEQRGMLAAHQTDWVNPEASTPATQTPPDITPQHELQVTTDQKVGDSSSPGRAEEEPVQPGISPRPFHGPSDVWEPFVARP
ncbi:MAG: hypothetical protein GY788_27830 [bacterium]|nr:hypothetical protein [bacterium]